MSARVLVAGASGAIGRPLVRQLVEALVHELTSLPDVFDFKDPELYTAG